MLAKGIVSFCLILAVVSPALAVQVQVQVLVGDYAEDGTIGTSSIKREWFMIGPGRLNPINLRGDQTLSLQEGGPYSLETLPATLAQFTVTDDHLGGYNLAFTSGQDYTGHVLLTSGANPSIQINSGSLTIHRGNGAAGWWIGQPTGVDSRDGREDNVSVSLPYADGWRIRWGNETGNYAKFNYAADGTVTVTALYVGGALQNSSDSAQVLAAFATDSNSLSLPTNVQRVYCDAPNSVPTLDSWRIEWAAVSPGRSDGGLVDMTTNLLPGRYGIATSSGENAETYDTFTITAAEYGHAWTKQVTTTYNGVMYTWSLVGLVSGDANRDGKVNFDDYLVLEANFGSAGTTWTNADFDENGIVNFDDYLALEANFGAGTAAPEPMTLALLGLGSLALLRRQ